tara:strand:- start:216 stop:896 length:681 start_codon:yes stop_codon:yes gene_type:complete
MKWLKDIILKHLGNTLLTGSLLAIPFALTYIVVDFLFKFIDGILNPAIKLLYEHYHLDTKLPFNIFPGIGVISALLIIYVVGFAFYTAAGRSAVSLLQKTMLNIPLVGPIYLSTRKLVESFSGSRETGFKRVVLIQFPREGFWSVGFLTGIVQPSDFERKAVVYVPTAPMPNSGFVVLVNLDEIYDTDLKISDALQFVLSGGIISPDHIKTAQLDPNNVYEDQATN